MSNELIAMTGLTVAGKRITAIEDNLSSNSQSALGTVYAVNQALLAIVLTGANPGEVYNVKSYGAVANAVVPASGNVVTGTNNLTAFNNCIAAAPSNATVFVPSGNYLVQGGVTQITSKRLNYFQVGNVYTNGTDFLTFNRPGGAPRCHNINILGSVIGRVNLTTNTRALFLASGGVNFAAYTGSALKILNDVYGSCFRMNFIEGFKNAVEVAVGGADGSQENTVAIQRINNCANGIHLRSTDGVSWCDHTIFCGPDGGHLHINGGDLGLKIDGYSGAAATNGEVYNGAFRSNQFKFLLSHMNKYIEINGDVTDSHFDIVMEGGTNTGVWGTPAIQCRSVSPNYLRSPRWRGRGILNTPWLLNGMGIDGTIEMPIWLNNNDYIGNVAKINSSGTINVQVRPTLSLTTRNALPTNIKCVNDDIPKAPRTVTATTAGNTSADINGVILLNNATMTFTATAASTNVGVRFTVININASAATIAGVTGLTSLAQNKGADIECDGSTFRAIINP